MTDTEIFRSASAHPTKIIRSRADLAINGAPPAFEEPLHVGRPSLGPPDKYVRYITEIFERGWLTNNGPLVQELERRVAGHLGVQHCVAMCNGTIALEIAIRATGLRDEVIVPSWTFIATAHSLFWQGITPVFADIDPVTQNLDPGAVRRMVTPRTTGIIGVHVWGRAAPVEQLQNIADEFGLQLIFDAAHAFGSTYKGQTIGRFGACEVLSFHATKSFNTMEGGAVVTNDGELAEAMRLMRNFGFSGYDNVIHPGTNGKMIEACAAMGLTNLDVLEEVEAANKRSHARYTSAFSGLPGVAVLQYDPAERNSHHYVVVELEGDHVARRDDIIAALHAENILARKYFWPGCHRMKPYRDLFPHAGLLLPNTDDVARRVIVLPTGMHLPDEAVDVVGSVLLNMIDSGEV